MILREKNIVVDKGLAAGERGVPANEQGNNPPAWPAEGAGQGLYRLRRQGHHIADRPLAVKMAIAVDLALADLQRGGPDLLTARPRRCRSAAALRAARWHPQSPCPPPDRDAEW